MEEIEYKKMYDVEESHWWYTGLHELILYFIGIERTKRGPLEILDAGCGTGQLCQLMNKYGNVRGCDISEIAIELCSKRKVAVFHADLNTADLGIERYNVITSIDVLYHQKIQNDSEVLSRFHKALKPGGIVILNLPAYNFLKSRHDMAVHTRERYTKSAMIKELKEQGFAVEKATYRIGFLFPIIAPYRFMQHSDKDKPVSDVNMPPKVINSTLLALNRMENLFIKKISSIPFGTSLFLVVRKPA